MRRSQAQEDAVSKAGKVSGERRRAAAKRRRDAEHREAQQDAKRRSEPSTARSADGHALELHENRVRPPQP